MYDPPDDKPRPATAPGAQAPPRYGRPVEPYRLWRALYRAKWVLAGVALAALGAGIVAGKILVKRSYVSEVHLLWEPTEAERMDPNTRDLFTRIDSVKLPRNLAAIRQRLAIPQELVAIAQRIDLRFDPDSNLVTLEAAGGSPDEAAALADTAAKVFLESEGDLARTRLQETATTTRRQLEAARAQLATDRSAYDAFRQEHGISDLTLETQRAIESAAELSAQAAVERERARRFAALAGVKRRPGTVGSSAERQALEQRLSDARGRLATARAQFSDEHPRVQSLISEVEQLQAQLRGSALANPFPDEDPAGPRPPIRPTVRLDGGAAETTYGRLEAQARERLARLSAIEGQASSLLATVRVDEARVAELEAASARADDAARAPSPGFRIISPATLPEAPAKSFRRVIAITVPLVLFALALLGVLLWALRGLRVYTANEAAYWGRAPVVGSSTWPQPPNTLKALVDELGDYTPDARGATLVVAATKREEELAEAVASRMQLAVPTTLEPLRSAGPVRVDVRTREVVVDADGEVRGRDTFEEIPLRTPGTAIVAASAGGPSAITDPLAGDAPPSPAYVIDLWKGQLAGPQLRRAARLADRVVVVVSSGSLSIREIAELRTRLGRAGGVGFLILNLPADLVSVADRAGPVEQFWLPRR